jgi:uncharacterized membrane protein (Fun14 family)
MIRILGFVTVFGLASSAWAGFNHLIVNFQQIPTLDDIGLGALIALVGGVAGWVLRKRSSRK